MKQILFSLLYFLFSFASYSQTLIMNEVSQGVSGNMEYAEFVVIDASASYICGNSEPPAIDIRGWIFDDNSGYHGTGGIAAGAVRFSYDPLWSAVPMGTIILIYNDASPDPTIPAQDLSLSDGNCRIVAPISDVNLFESNLTTPGAIACSYPATGWTAGGNWSNTFLANTGDCARIVNLSGCEVFSICYGDVALNTMIYFSAGAELSADHRNTVYYFSDGDPSSQGNWTIGCTDNETVLDANQCGANLQTPGLPNNAANEAFISHYNNSCQPITPVDVVATLINDEICGCDGQASASSSGSIPGYTYEWLDIINNPIAQTTVTATGLCAGTYKVVVTSSIGCTDTATVIVNSAPVIQVAATNSGTICQGDILSLSETAGDAVSWSWTTDGSATFSSATAQSPEVSGATDGEVFTVTITTTTGCTITDQTIASVNPLPIITLTSTDPSECNLSDGSILVSGSGNGNVSWTGGNQPSVNLPYTIPSLPAGSYDVTFEELVTGCNSLPVTVVLNNPGAPQIINPGTQTSCGSFVLPDIAGTNLSGNEGYYSLPSGLGSQLLPGSAVSGSQTLYIYDSNGSCNDEVSFDIIVNPLPSASISGGGVFCNPEPGIPQLLVSMTGTPNFSLTYTLNGSSQTSAGISSNTLSFNTEGIYELISISDANCTNSLIGNDSLVFVYNTTAPTVIPAENSFCQFAPFEFMTAQGIGTFAWYSDAGLTQFIAEGNSLLPLDIAGTTNYYVQQTISECPGPPALVVITVDPCEIIVPTAFTPDADNTNDYWELINLDTYYPDNIVTVYNRWGTKIYESIQGQYNSTPWDGKFEGKQLPVASYYFIIDFQQDLVDPITGIVSIVIED